MAFGDLELDLYLIILSCYNLTYLGQVHEQTKESRRDSLQYLFPSFPIISSLREFSLTYLEWQARKYHRDLACTHCKAGDIEVTWVK